MKELTFLFVLVETKVKFEFVRMKTEQFFSRIYNDKHEETPLKSHLK